MKITNDKIASIKNNLFYRSRDIVEDYTSFPWHKYIAEVDTDKVQSSQALAIDFWGCLNSSKFKDELINNYFNIISSDWNIELEYTDASLLNESPSTQIDVLLTSVNHAIFIESKFTEGGGRCSQPKKQCNGNYQLQINPKNGIKNKCALTGKGIKYWDYIDSITEFKKDNEYLPCPIKGMEYQWMRNLCFAKAFSEENGGVSVVNYLFYYNSPKCHIASLIPNNNYLGTLKEKLNSSFYAKSYNDYIDFCIAYLEQKDPIEMKVWMELKSWLTKKEQRIR